MQVTVSGIMIDPTHMILYDNVNCVGAMMISTDGVYIGSIGTCKLSIDIVEPLAIKGRIIFGNAHSGIRRRTPFSIVYLTLVNLSRECI